MFSTLNESRLHKSLKIFYASRYGGKTEIQVEQWVCDIVCGENSVIEIQTKNVSALAPKIKGLLALKKKLTVVHPVIVQKTITTSDSKGKPVSSRKSPKKENLYSMLRELTGIYDMLLDKNFTLLCPFITMEEKRTLSEMPEQSKNKRRRFKKEWQKTDKALLTVGEEYKFHGKKAYLSLLPKELPEEFSSKEVRAALAKEYRPYTNLVLWLLSRMGLIEYVKTKDRLKYYRHL